MHRIEVLNRGAPLDSHLPMDVSHVHAYGHHPMIRYSFVNWME